MSEIMEHILTVAPSFSCAAMNASIKAKNLFPKARYIEAGETLGNNTDTYIITSHRSQDVSYWRSGRQKPERHFTQNFVFPVPASRLHR